MCTTIEPYRVKTKTVQLIKFCFKKTKISGRTGSNKLAAYSAFRSENTANTLQRKCGFAASFIQALLYSVNACVARVGHYIIYY